MGGIIVSLLRPGLATSVCVGLALLGIMAPSAIRRWGEFCRRYAGRRVRVVVREYRGVGGSRRGIVRIRDSKATQRLR